MSRTIQGPDGPIVLPRWYPTPQEVQERERILRGKFFLVQQSGGPMGEVMRCRRCGGKHRYLTLQCIEQPFSGITGGLYAYYYHMGDSGAFALLPPDKRAKYELLVRQFTGGTPDIATSHPELARKFNQQGNALDLAGIALGILERVAPSEARRLVDRINMTAQPPLVVPGINDTRAILEERGLAERYAF